MAPSGRALPGWALAALLWLLGGPAARADDYQLGHGLDLGPFNLAGYSNLVGNLPDQGARSLVLDDLSLFVSGHVAGWLNPFMEAELTGATLARSGAGPSDGDLVLERLYDDAYLTDDLTLRLGKMLAPVGEWNQIHAAPLVLTTVRPAVTYRNFSEYVTGASLLFSDPQSALPDLQLYWQPGGELSERPATITVHQYADVAGAQVSLPLGLLDRVGVSFQSSRDVRGVRQSLFGLDAHYTVGPLTLAAEGTFSDVSSSGTRLARDAEWGAYVSAAYALDEEWSLYGWYEGFADRTRSSVAADLLLGAGYHLHPASVIKLEYLQNVGGQPVNPTGLFASWSVLF